MDLLTTIIKRELFRRMRQKRFYLRRMAFVLVAGSLVILGFLSSSRLGTTTSGLQIFNRVSTLLLIAACFAAPWGAAPVMAREQEDGSLGLVFLTDMRPWEIVVGKLVPAILAMVIAIMSGVPLLILCVTLGGVSASQICMGTALLLAAVFLGSCLGLGISAASCSGKRALIAAIVGSIALFVGLPAAIERWADLSRNPFVDGVILPAVSPFRALDLVVSGKSMAPAAWNCLFNLALGLPFLALACRLVPRLAFDDAKDRPSARRLSRRSAPLRGGPVAWREGVSSMRPRTAWLFCILTVTGGMIGAALLRGSRFLGIPRDIGIVPLSLYSAWAVSAGVSAIWITTACATSFGTEKRSRALELLALTSLSESEIVLGKLWAPFKACLPWLVALCLAVGLLAVTSEVNPGHGFLAITVTVSAVFGPACLALYLSLRYARFIAIGLTALICIPWMLGASASAVSAGGAAFFILANLALAYVALGKLMHRLRQVSAGEKAWS